MRYMSVYAGGTTQREIDDPPKKSEGLVRQVKAMYGSRAADVARGNEETLNFYQQWYHSVYVPRFRDSFKEYVESQGLTYRQPARLAAGPRPGHIGAFATGKAEDAIRMRYGDAVPLDVIGLPTGIETRLAQRGRRRGISIDDILHYSTAHEETHIQLHSAGIGSYYEMVLDEIQVGNFLKGYFTRLADDALQKGDAQKYITYSKLAAEGARYARDHGRAKETIENKGYVATGNLDRKANSNNRKISDSSEGGDEHATAEGEDGEMAIDGEAAEDGDASEGGESSGGE